MASSFTVKRWYCLTCDHRIVPYDSYESLTEIEGGKKGPTLLSSLNAKEREKAEREGKTYSATGWCWVCEKWVHGYQLTQMDLVKRYLRRDGIQIRTHSKGMKAAIEEIIARAS
jgi:hypothetical protein